MHFVLQTPSLQRLAGIKTVAALWNHSDVLRLIAELSEVSEEDDLEWKSVRGKVESHALALELTQPCKHQLLKLIKPLGRKILDWCNSQYIFDEDNFDSPLLRCLLPRTFCWTMHGVIDHGKTAELMVKDESLVLERQYDLACVHGLEEAARELFQRMDEEPRQEYINTATNDDQHQNLIAYFSCTLSGQLNQLNSTFQQLITPNLSITDYLFFRSLYSSNRATSEYFFNKVNLGEKHFMLVNLARSVFGNCRDRPHCNLLYYLSLTNAEQQRRIFRECIGDVLICLLGWPMQSLFIETAVCGWPYMRYHDYEKVLCAIAGKISDDYQDYNYSQLFWECWSLAPADVKRRLLDDVAFLERLYETKEDEFMKLILNEAPAHQIDKLIEKCRENIRGLKEKNRVFLENEMSDAALMEWKETAAVNSENDDREDKRVKREIIRLIDIKMESRKKRRL